MLRAWITLFVLCHEVSGFLIHNTQHSLCLEDLQTVPGAGAGAGAVGLRVCSLDSRLQQWVWWNRRVLKNLGSDRCLAGRGGAGQATVWTAGCHQELDGEETAVAALAVKDLLWDCEGGRLISVSSSLELSVDDSMSPALSLKSKRSGKWRSLDQGDICQESLRSKRASKEPEEFEEPLDGADPRAAMAGMTEEQKKFLMWYYRTEDPTTWKFVMLGLCFFCLLVGFLLLGMGSMANKNRRQTAKYKAAAAELLILKEIQGCSALETSSDKGHTVPLYRPGEIVVSWADGNVSTLYPDPLPEEEEKDNEEEKKGKDMAHSADMEESRRDKSVVEDEEEQGVCNEEGVQQMMNWKVE
ncbi:hypothetical protein CRUP_019447 [Coryphaenoides rupestris]|nr:hypothetical protein CRUP_019447 [Coryphaenoides rupestris]